MPHTGSNILCPNKCFIKCLEACVKVGQRKQLILKTCPCLLVLLLFFRNFNNANFLNDVLWIQNASKCDVCVRVHLCVHVHETEGTSKLKIKDPLPSPETDYPVLS